MKKHTLAFNKEGDALSLNNLKKVEPFIDQKAFDNHIQEIIDNIKDFSKSHKRTDGKTQLFFYVHGALNTIKSANSRAEKNYKNILKNNKYPIFINWEAGMFSAYADHLFWVRQGRKNAFMGFLTSPLYLIYDLMHAIVKLPLVWGWQVKNRFAGETGRGVFQLNTKWNHSMLRDLFERDKESEGTLRISPKYNEVSLGVWKYIGFAIVTLLMLPFRLLISPILATGGTNAWRIYKRRTFNLFRKPKEFDVREEREKNITNFPMVRRTGDLSCFLDKLITELGGIHVGSNTSFENKLEAFNQNYAIDLAGHSTGAIVLNNLVTEYPKLAYSNIVYMGAACTIRSMYRTIIPYMLRNQDTKLFILTLDPRAEMRENLKPFFPLLPAGSLLEWLDVYFTSPPQNMDRILGKWVNLMAIQHIFPQSIRKRVTLKKFNYHENEETQPQKHGEFDDFSHFHKEDYWSV